MNQDKTLHQRMSDALWYIQTSLDRAIDPKAVAERACFSLSHFHRIFKGMMRETLGEHIRRLRLERAAVQLAYGKEQVTSIAFNAGYETLESFSRAFKKMFNMPPSTFREGKQRLRFPDTPSNIHYQPGVLPDLNSLPRNHEELDLKIKKFGPIRIAFIRNVGPYKECATAWEKLCTWAQVKNILHEDTLFLGICYDDPTITPANKIRYEASIIISEEISPEGEITIKEIPCAEYAVSTHYGSYEGLEETYTNIMGHWLPGSGRDVSDQPCIEIYKNSPEQVAPEDLVTDIYIPLV